MEHGLLSNAEQDRRGLKHHSIAIDAIQRTRSQMEVTCGPGGVVHDYVPFYFCKRSPMLLSVVNARNVDQNFLVHLALPISVLQQPTAVFADASANRMTEPPTFHADPENLTQLNWNEIDSLKWSSPDERSKQQKMAEMLVHEHVPWSDIASIIVWNKVVADWIREECEKRDLTPPTIDFDTKHYYTKISSPGHSLVTGPYWTKRSYEEAVKRVLENLGQADAPKFRSLVHLRNALRENISCVNETAELVGLMTSNFLHPQDLGTHTEEVADNLRALPEYARLNETDQIITELAAYFHDIGKGPKSRWARTDGVYKGDRDHPVDALPMVERILTEDVKKMKRRSARVILKLVCYHDLIGDILGKGRNEEQLFEIIDDERELDMLIALSKADVQAVHTGWWNDDATDDLKERTLQEIHRHDEDEDD